MSQERFDWLDQWCANPAEDVIRTVGTESNVKEIYDACNELAKDPTNFVLNQFCEFGNHLGHYEITGRALGHVFEHVARRQRARPPPRRVHQRHRIGRHHRRRRPPEGRVRHEDRRRRGARVPDDARERLRRAQHPGHRRQAHPADPQRHQHRRRRRDQRPRHRRARRAVQHARRARAYLVDRTGVPAGARRDARALRVLVDLQRARRDQDREAARARARRRDRHDRHRRRGAVPERAGEDDRRRASAASSTTSTRPRCSASTSPTSRPTRTLELHRARPQPHLQPRLLHVGRAAGHAVRAVRGTPRSSRSGAGCGASCRSGTR